MSEGGWEERERDFEKRDKTAERTRDRNNESMASQGMPSKTKDRDSVSFCLLALCKRHRI